jgi:predicted metal-dependent hydrolase
MVFVDNFETDKNTELFKNQVRYVANKWSNQKAKEILITKINKYSKIIGVRRLQIVIKNLKIDGEVLPKRIL